MKITKLKIKKKIKKGNERVPPIVFGEVKSKSNPQGKTILFYNHYDDNLEDLLKVRNNRKHQFRELFLSLQKENRQMRCSNMGKRNHK